jgi:hypothetical protein
MRYVKSLLLSVLISAGFLTMDSFALSQYYPLTASQNHFTHIITQLRTFRSVQWESPVSMWVQIPSSQSGRAAELANTIEDRARTALFQPFCVHIYATKGSELARSCVY